MKRTLLAVWLLVGLSLSAATPITIGLADSGVTAGTYSNATITVDAKGRITLAVSGSGGGSYPTNIDAYSITVTNLTVSGSASIPGGGGGTSVGIDGVAVSPINLSSGWYGRYSVSGSNATLYPKLLSTNTGSTFTPDFSLGQAHEFTLTGDTTLAAPSNVTTNMVGSIFRLVFVQSATGGKTITNTASEYKFGTDITALTLRTNASGRDYAVVYVRATNAFDVIGFVRGY